VESSSGGGSSAAQVEPTDERLSAAIQRTKSSWAGTRIGAGSATRSRGLRRASTPSRSATTMPTRAAPRSGAKTRWPGASCQPSGTR